MLTPVAQYMKICPSHNHTCQGTEGWSAHLRQHQQQRRRQHQQRRHSRIAHRRVLHRILYHRIVYLLLHRIHRRHRQRRYHARLLCPKFLTLSRLDHNLKDRRKTSQLSKKFLRKGCHRQSRRSQGRSPSEWIHHVR